MKAPCGVAIIFSKRHIVSNPMDHPQMVMTNSECCSGPIIAYGKVGPSPDTSNKYRDINFNDFRHVADYLVSYRWGHTSNLYQPTFARTKGVRINCYGDQKLLNKPHFEEIELSPMDIILTEHDTSDIAKRIGLPIFTKRCSPDPSWANLHDSKIYENMDATYLHLCCDPEAEFDPSLGNMANDIRYYTWRHSITE